MCESPQVARQSWRVRPGTTNEQAVPVLDIGPSLRQYAVVCVPMWVNGANADRPVRRKRVPY